MSSPTLQKCARLIRNKLPELTDLIEKYENKPFFAAKQKIDRKLHTLNKNLEIFSQKYPGKLLDVLKDLWEKIINYYDENSLDKPAYFGIINTVDEINIKGKRQYKINREHPLGKIYFQLKSKQISNYVCRENHNQRYFFESASGFYFHIFRHHREVVLKYDEPYREPGPSTSSDVEMITIQKSIPLN